MMESEKKAASDQSGNRLRELAFDGTKSCNKARLICLTAPPAHEDMHANAQKVEESSEKGSQVKWPGV